MRITDTTLKVAIILRQAEWLRQKFKVFRHQQALELQQVQQELQQLQARVKPLEAEPTHTHNRN